MDTSPLPAIRLGLVELHQLIPLADRRTAAVSGWSVGEHISHSALVDCAVFRRVLGPTPPDPGLEAAGNVALSVLATGTLRRGLAKSPPAAQPTATDAGSLRAGLEAAERLIQEVEPALPRLFADPSLIRHGLFGGLDRGQWLRLLAIHQRHHLDIIADILNRPPLPDAPGASAQDL